MNGCATCHSRPAPGTGQLPKHLHRAECRRGVERLSGDPTRFLWAVLAMRIDTRISWAKARLKSNSGFAHMLLPAERD
jgi:hypothetical protein